MTREEAIEILGQYHENFEPYNVGDIVCAIEMAIEALEQESVKFYYVESIDDYWIGQRHDNFYYAKWNSKLGFVWSVSKYLPWGEHIVAEHTLWKEYTYPSKPKEIPFIEWIIGFVKKHFQQEPKRGNWEYKEIANSSIVGYWCNQCHIGTSKAYDFCPHCGARMESDEE